jgi:hypothetical protein
MLEARRRLRSRFHRGHRRAGCERQRLVRFPGGPVSAGAHYGADQRRNRHGQSDDYAAKIKLWASNPQVVPQPPLPKLPQCGSKKSSRYAEFNAWKRELLKQIAAEAKP